MLLHAPKNSEGHRSFFGLGSEENGTERKPNGSWNDVADLMLMNLKENGHPLFRGTSASFREALKSKGGGRTSIHFHAEPETAELLLRIIISVISSVSTEQWRVGVKNLLRRLQTILQLVQGILWPT